MAQQRVSPIKELAKQRQLLLDEWNAEKEDFQRQTQAVGLRRKVKRGDCWLPVTTGRSYYNSLNQLTLELTRSADADVEHNFEYGRQVMFFQLSPGGEINYFGFTGTVSYAQDGMMAVMLASESHVAALRNATYELGVQLSFDETTYRLMLAAIDNVSQAKGNRLAELRDIFYNPSKTQTLAFAPLSFPWLNATQQHAVNEVLRALDVAVVHGPPGTGKTTTLVEAIYETLRRETQVMVCAQSNMAVDWISERLMDRGIDVLRLGNPTRVTDKMLAATYERRFAAHPLYPQLWAIRRNMRDLRAHHSKISGAAYHNKLEKLKNKAIELEATIRAELLGQSRVIACTLAGSASHLIDFMRFNTLFIDEAAQALEAACWIAIAKANRVILAGDHCQLPPTVKSLAALKGGLGYTLMERIVDSNPQVVTLLKVQYRMNDDIMRFPSRWFYHGQVQSAPQVRSRSILDFDTAIEWIDTAAIDGAREEFVGESYGRVNKAEAKLTVETLVNYLNKIGMQHAIDDGIDIGVISPYRAQVQHLRGLLRKEAFLKPIINRISVNTVDGFQGQERDIIIISLVRSNDKGQIGFLRDLRRMNVAMTRARMKLIILGDAATLTRHPFYKQLYDYVKQLSTAS